MQTQPKHLSYIYSMTFAIFLISNTRDGLIPSRDPSLWSGFACLVWTKLRYTQRPLAALIGPRYVRIHRYRIRSSNSSPEHVRECETPCLWACGYVSHQLI
ncbi:hypothetical protein I7I50_11471 [Histoplasma capsulatum G186AR]|uniref:Uncharacterized protein n=1 Tax=Ajellomyces capsulatus TaxID=5037 RepID=A0A8H7Z598_AJECA|nr:hypothetical protein I7I52_02709 [Histoplasma capsulatum]QSS69988.1 hypothetical protein I7I50_11471 [Histoplasma capsulatum G186AR]